MTPDGEALASQAYEFSREVLAYQVEEIRLERKAVEAIQRLAVSMIAAGLAGLAVYLGAETDVELVPFLLLSLGAVLTMVATIFLLLGTGAGAAPRAATGPHPAAVAAAVVEPSVDRQMLLRSFVAHAPGYFRGNHAYLIALMRRRVAGVLVMVLGLSAHALAIVFIAWGAVDG